jgi:hypothetical protein
MVSATASLYKYIRQASPLAIDSSPIRRDLLGRKGYFGGDFGIFWRKNAKKW